MTIKKRTIVLLKLWAIGIVFASTLFLWGYIYFKTPFFTVTAYELQGAPDMYNEKIAASLEAVSSSLRYKVFPSNRIIGYPASQMRSAVVDILPNTASVKIFPTGLHTLRIQITHYTPLFKIDETRGITHNGIIYTELNDMSNLPTFFIASSTSEDIVEDGIHATKIEDLDEKDLANLTEFIHKIDRTIFPISKIYIDSYGDVTLYDKDEKNKILFSDKTDIDKVWSNLVSAIDTEPLKSKLSTQKDDLDYLDARFGNKVFYKFTSGLGETIIKGHVATTTATTTIR